MKFKQKKLNFNFALTSVLLVINLPSIALRSDSKQNIHIESDSQSIDIKGNTITFIGNVVITQGSRKINADKVIIIRPSGEQGNEIIDGYGNPSSFYQIQDNGKLVKGHALHIRYELANDLVILMGNAFLEQQDGHITGDKITYLVKEQKMQAYSEKGKRVTTVLVSVASGDSNKTKPLHKESH